MNFDRLLMPLRRALINLAVKGIVTLVNDDGAMQVVQATLLEGASHDGIENYQPYGLAYCPKPGALGLFLALGGHRSHTVAAVVSDPRYRPTGLESGEVMLYTDEGDQIHFKRGREIVVTAGVKVTVTAPEVVVAASTRVAVVSPAIDLYGNVSITGTGKLNGLNIAVVP